MSRTFTPLATSPPKELFQQKTNDVGLVSLHALSEREDWNALSSQLKTQPRAYLQSSLYGSYISTQSRDGLPVVNRESLLHSCVRHSIPSSLFHSLLDLERLEADSRQEEVRVPMLAQSDVYGSTVLHEYAKVGRDVQLLSRLIGSFPLALFMQQRQTGLTPCGLAKRYNSYRNNVAEIQKVLEAATSSFSLSLVLFFSNPEACLTLTSSPLTLLERRNALVTAGNYLTFPSLRLEAENATRKATLHYAIYENQTTVKLSLNRAKSSGWHEATGAEELGVESGVLFAWGVVDLMMNSERHSIAELIVSWTGAL